MPTDPILDTLNPEQRLAVTHGAGPLLILAGAGSGKTRVLTHRVAYLIRDLGVPPLSILAVTFTNKAAREMKDRLERLVGREQVGELTVGTFHAFCARLLRQDGPLVGVDRGFVIFDEADQRALLRRAMADAGVSEKLFTPGAIGATIAGAKNELKGPADLAQVPKHQLERVAAMVWPRYEALLRENNALDFDDLIVKPVRLLESHPDIRAAAQERWKYIHIDEYQDTSALQGKFVEILVTKHKNLFVVGDIDQCVYSWRSATIENLLEFEKTYPDAQTIILEQNYRSTKTIVDAANRIIEVNKNRKEKRSVTQNPDGEPITIHAALSAEQEAGKGGIGKSEHETGEAADGEEDESSEDVRKRAAKNRWILAGVEMQNASRAGAASHVNKVMGAAEQLIEIAGQFVTGGVLADAGKVGGGLPVQ